MTYSCEVAPVVVTVDGTKNVAGEGEESAYATLVGRGARGRISAAGFTLSNWSWSIDGDKFADYITDSEGKIIELNPADLQTGNPHWYWKTPTTNVAAVRCTATATIDGIPIGSVTGEVFIDVQAPTSTLEPKRRSAKYAYEPAGAGPINWDSANSAGYSVQAMLFGAQIDLPEDFSTDGGDGCFAQVFSGSEQTNGGTPDLYNSVLDYSFPYAPQGYSPTFSVSGAGNTVDSPNIGNLKNVLSFAVSYEFKMYLLFKPSGNDSRWVPLQKVEWKSTVGAERLTLTSPWPYTSPRTVTNSENKILSVNMATDHPLWKSIK